MAVDIITLILTSPALSYFLHLGDPSLVGHRPAVQILGAFAFASLASLTHALNPEFVQSLGNIGLEAPIHPAATIFWSGVLGGWIIARVAWLVSGSHSITGSVMIIWLLAFVVGLGSFAH